MVNALYYILDEKWSENIAIILRMCLWTMDSNFENGSTLSINHMVLHLNYKDSDEGQEAETLSSLVCFQFASFSVPVLFYFEKIM